MDDRARSLESLKVKTEREGMLNEDHIRSLTQFVIKMRNEKNLKNEIPYFDPLDGGLNARVLCLLQDPGKKTQETGFVSRNNPDPTAENFFNFYREARIPRNETIIWNIVPWTIVNMKDYGNSFNDGIKYLKELLAILPNLEVIIFHGGEAQYAKSVIEKEFANLKMIGSWHTSNLGLNRYPHKRDEIRSHLKEIYNLLYKKLDS